ncbi:MAG TPA: ScyD/ScyE family protein [Thermoanaerobaculia bacterium]|nr:ScyD/ScyE family protein [Thermoanaerobaculia bacterium]
MRLTVRSLVALCLLCVLASAASAVDARKCGKPGSRCEVLAQNLENARSISRIQPDGTFFVGTAGNAQADLIGELISDRDTDTSAIYRYTEARGLQPWIGGKPSQFMMAFDVSSRGYVPYQAGINGVEILGNDLYYTILYNRGTANYEKRSRSDTADTGISFGEVRKVIGGATTRSGQDVLLADLGKAELDLENPDGVLYPVADGFGHHAGEPVYAMNPYGLLPSGSSVWVADAAANDLFRIDQGNNALHLVTVFPNRLQTLEAVPIKVLQGPGDRLYVTLFFCSNAANQDAQGGIAEVRPDGSFRMVSFNRLPISAAVGPDGFLYVLEFSNMYAPHTGRLLRTTPKEYNDFNGRPASDGEVLIENLDYPVDMAFDAQGRLVIVESGTLDSFLVDGRVIRVTLP